MIFNIRSEKSLTILINGLVCLYIANKDEIKLLYSYIDVGDVNFVIELTTSGGLTKLEYDKIEKWKLVLGAIEKFLRGERIDERIEIKKPTK